MVRLRSDEAQERLASWEKLFIKASEFFSEGSVMEETNDFWSRLHLRTEGRMQTLV